MLSKQISVQRGYDVTEYTLNCFGGAGGQHACLVADALGMKSVFLHPFAGVLSAYGMGLADVRVMRESQVEKNFGEDAEQILTQVAAPLIDEVRAEVARQGVAEKDIKAQTKAHLRYEATDTSILVESGTPAEMRQNFEKAHKQQFGFVAEGRGLVIEAVSVEGIGVNEPLIDPELEVPATLKEPTIQDRVTICSLGIKKEVPLYARECLTVGQSLTGPAIITEATGTVVVEDGWRAQVNSRDHSAPLPL
jgi:5-oxoprolinase (ATP-hydrolysing)